jgi:hypothetical protein
MAGIKGQPTPTPKDLPSATPKSALDSYAMPEGSALAQYAGDGQAPAADQPSKFESPWYTAALPAVGATVGGIVGSGAGGVGAVPGAALGGAAGQSLRELIEVNVLGRPTGDLGESVKGVAASGLKEGGMALLGMGVVKGAGKLANSKLGQAAGAKIAEIADQPITYVRDFVKNKVSDIQKPFLEVLAKKTNPMNAEQSGDQVKSLLLQDVQQRFGDAVDLAEQYYAKFRDLFPKAVPSPTDAHLQETYYNQFGQLMPKSVNPKNFVETLQNVPSEKLVEKMWDPKNAAALRTLQQEVPKAFEQVAQARMNQVLRQANPDGVLDLGAVRTVLNKMPAATRELLVPSDEMKLLNKVVDNPRIARLKSLEQIGEEFVGKWAKRAYEVAHIGGEVAAKVPDTAVGRQVIGHAVQPLISPLANVYGSPQDPAPQE